MQERLRKIRFVSPRAETPWTGPPSPWRHPKLNQADSTGDHKHRIITPLFLHQTAWHQLDPHQANALAVALGQANVMVSVLRSEISTSDNQSLFHDYPQVDTHQSIAESGEPAASLPRMVPYRAERYGLTVEDFDQASIIDVRLTTNRDETGRFAYSAEQLARWDVLNAQVPIAGGSWVPSATFPPDVPNMEELRNKFAQLRNLSPSAAIFVTLDPFHLKVDLEGVLANNPDGIIIQFDSIASEGLELATLVVKTRQLINDLGHPSTPLWIVQGEINADDAAKLITLGASGVAIDSWFDHLWAEIQAASSGSFLSQSHYAAQANQLASDIQWYIQRTMGLLHSTEHLPKKQRLTSLDALWRDALQLNEYPKMN